MKLRSKLKPNSSVGIETLEGERLRYLFGHWVRTHDTSQPKPALCAACTRAGSNPGAGIETRVRGDGWDPMGLLESTPLYKAKGCGIYFGTGIETMCI